MRGAAGTRANRLDALRDLLVLYPGEWYFVRRVTNRSAVQSLSVNLRANGDSAFVVRQRKDGSGYRVYAKWAP